MNSAYFEQPRAEAHREFQFDFRAFQDLNREALIASLESNYVGLLLAKDPGELMEEEAALPAKFYSWMAA